MLFLVVFGYVQMRKHGPRGPLFSVAQGAGSATSWAKVNEHLLSGAFLGGDAGNEKCFICQLAHIVDSSWHDAHGTGSSIDPANKAKSFLPLRLVLERAL